MADISQYLQAIMSAVYGEDVRGSIHDAIDIINQVSEVVFNVGTAVTGPTSSSTGFFEDSIYLNTNTWDVWKCIGEDSWDLLGNIEGAPGNKWYRGINISGKSPTAQVYPTGIAEANPNDFYLNPQEGAIYYCVSGGDPTVATWAYDFTMTGGGGGVSQLEDLTDVDITTPADGQILEYDYASGKWKNGDNVSSMARYGGAKTFAELTSAILIAANVDKFYLCTDGGTIQNADAANWLLPVGSVIPPDSHIAVIEDPSTPGSYVFDDFGGYVDISGKADKVDVADKTDLASIKATGATNATGSTITKGTYFYLNNVLVRAKTDIAVGATFTSGTNYVTVTAGALNTIVGALPKFYYFYVTIGTTKTIPMDNSTTLVLFLTGPNATSTDIYNVNCSSAGGVNIMKTGGSTGTDITVTSSTNTLNIKNNNNNASLQTLAIVYRGDITV